VRCTSINLNRSFIMIKSFFKSPGLNKFVKFLGWVSFGMLVLQALAFIAGFTLAVLA